MLTKPITVCFTPPQEGQEDYMGVIDLWFDDADEVALTFHGSREEADALREVLGTAPANVAVSIKDESVGQGADRVFLVNETLAEPLPVAESGKPVVIGRPFGVPYPGEAETWMTRRQARKLAALVGSELHEA